MTTISSRFLTAKPWKFNQAINQQFQAKNGSNSTQKWQQFNPKMAAIQPKNGNNLKQIFYSKTMEICFPEK